MLFGNEELRKKLLEIITQNSVMNNHIIIYGVTLGSMAKGIQRYDSDYDSKFFYCDDLERKHLDLEENWYSEWKDTAYRYIPQDTQNGTLFYDKLAIWDMGSFLEVLINPSDKNRGISPELYFQVIYSLISPYHWDPYGLTNKILPIVWNVYDLNYLFLYYERYIKQRYKIYEGNKVAIREYLNAAQVILSMKWILKYDSAPPLYLQSLLSECENEEIERLLNSLYKDLEKATYDLIDERGSYKRKISKFILIPQIDKMHNYLMNELDKNRQLWLTKKEIYQERTSVRKQVEAVKRILNIIQISQKEVKVKDVNE